jgi:4-amino-4-deoxy-L-arabinose transferase-like glycosyltransferase
MLIIKRQKKLMRLHGFLNYQSGVHIFLSMVRVLTMLTGFNHPYLWSPDEPREAEIARETLVNSQWITPHLCGLPFLEKPPLFYNIVALAYRLTGSITPLVARAVSLLFGMSILILVFLLGYSWSGFRLAWLASLLLLVMPAFYKYSHLILLDIAVGAFCTLGIACFA